MFRVIRFWSIVIFFVTGMLVVPALASSTIDKGTQESGAVYRIYFPENWNGDLVVFAHSYVPPVPPGTHPQITDSELKINKDDPASRPLPDLFTERGYAFAVTSYSKTGLAVVQGVADVVDLVNIFKANTGNPRNIYLVGLSQGGLVCTLALEQNPGVFSGGLSLNGPIGDFRRQINYWTDFRVVFDYYFQWNPDMRIPNTAVDIDETFMVDWVVNSQFHQNQVVVAIIANREATGQLLRVTQAAIDPTNSNSVFNTVISLLTYNIIATNDGKETLNGQPFDNLDRLYGSNDDIALNLGVQRFTADPIALEEIQAHYETSGHLNRPLVSMRTKYDPIVPYWHENSYKEKIFQNGLAKNFLSIDPLPKYGHYNFTDEEMLDGFAQLVLLVTGGH